MMWEVLDEDKGINLEAVRLEDCVDLFEKKDICTVISDGNVTDFCTTECEDYL